MAVSAEDEEVLTKGLDYLGRDISLGLTGTSDVPAGATGIPAPSAPGGMAGFAGGAGSAAQRGGGPGGGADIMGIIGKALDAIYKGGKLAKSLTGSQPASTTDVTGAEKPRLSGAEGAPLGTSVTDVSPDWSYSAPGGGAVSEGAGKPGLALDATEPPAANAARGTGNLLASTDEMLANLSNLGATPADLQSLGLTGAEIAKATPQGAEAAAGGGLDIGTALKLLFAGLQQSGAFSGPAGAEMAKQVQTMTAPITTQVGGMLGPYGGAVAMAVQAIMDSYNEFANTAKLKSGAYNNPIKGQLYSAATEGVGNANKLLDQFAGGYENVPTETLLSTLAQATNNVLPYFQTAEGGVGPIRASDSAGSPGTQTPDQYTQQFTTAKDRIAGLTKELFNRGLTYEQIGQLPVSPGWTGLSLDAGGGPWEYYARGKADYAKTMPSWGEVVQGSPQIQTRTQNVDPGLPNYQAPASWDEAPRYQSEYSIKAPEGLLPNEQGFSPHAGSFSYTPWAYAGAGTEGSQIQPGAFTPDNAFLAALGPVGYSPSAMRPEEQAKGKAGQPDVGAMQGVASMYGGPFWAAMARMGQGEFAPLIQQNFNPWASWSQMSPEQRLTAMGPSVLGPMQMNKDAGIYGGSWGQVENPRVADFFSGYTPPPLGPGYQPPARPTTGQNVNQLTAMINALVNGGEVPRGSAQGHAEGMLSEEERRRAGM